jgi:L-alanine-DL-glutamate epimerase-like enolase superfamily enzyme
MKITEIRGYHVGFPLAEPIGNAVTFMTQREFLMLEVVTDAGITGWGDVGAAPHPAAAFIRSRLARILLGQSPLETGRLWQAMTAVLNYDRRGVGTMGISAVDLALHDISAKAQGISVAALLGGAVRDRVFAYASGPFMIPGNSPYARFEAEVEGYCRRGFRGIKPRGGFSPRADSAMAIALRKQLGPDVALMVDFNRGYTAPAAIEAARRMDEASLLWIEEPVLPEDVPGYQAFTRIVPTAVAGGEALGSLAAYREFFVANCLAVVQPDMTVCGGYSGMRRVAALAQAFDLPVMPHVFGTTINYHASLQMAAVLEGRRGGGPMPYPFMEVDVTPNPLLALGGDPALNDDGTITVPGAPGTGLELTAEQLKPWMRSSWTERL